MRNDRDSRSGAPRGQPEDREPIRSTGLDPEVTRLPRTYVPRHRLWERLDEATDSPVTLLVGPAGTGKTLGVRGWLRYGAAAQTEGARWLHADETWGPSRLASVLAEAEPGESDPGATPALVVIDDAHAMPAGSIRMLDERLDTAPDTMRVLLISNWDLPLTRLVPELLGNFSVLRGEILLMSDAEAGQLVVAHARTSDERVVRMIIEHAQGWCAALVLAARAVAAAPDKVIAARELSEGNTPVADRLTGEVFASLSARQRHLLLCISAERVVTAATAAHLSHDPLAGDVLSDLEATGLLVTGVPAEGPAAEQELRYHVHPLMAEVVRRRIVAGGVDVARARSTVVRAVQLDGARGSTEGAFGRLLALNATDQAVDLLAHEGVRLVLGQGAGAQVAELVRAHPETVENRADTWFGLALERWYIDDVTGARHWAEKLLRHAESGPASPERHVPLAQIACIRLWRSRLGLEPMQAALDFAVRALVTVADMADTGERAVLLSEVGITQNWLGDLGQAGRALTSAISTCRSQGLVGLATASMAHLAFTEYMAGRESRCVEVATDALAAVGSAEVRGLPFAGSRASIALLLGTLVDLPWPDVSLAGPQPVIGRRVQTADLCAKFWMRMRDARLALAAGSVYEAERLLPAPTESFLPESDLPEHLHVVVLVERAMLAALSSDRAALTSLEMELTAMNALGEAALARGLSCDLDGDRGAACVAFADAAANATFAQPPTRALALTCHAQLLDALGDREHALNRLRTAAGECERRRNAVPFLGWTRQGTPMKVLLPALQGRSPSAWIGDLAEAARGRPDANAHFAALTATPGERQIAPNAPLSFALSPREREVLGELARGSTYADIAANLFVSENTVKTHVSSLYGKLGVSRRREALAVARSRDLL